MSSALVLIVVACSAPVEEPAVTEPVALEAAEVLEGAIDFHDPERRWPEIGLVLELEETRPDDPGSRRTTLRLDNASGVYEIRQRRTDGHETLVRIEDDRLTEALLDGSPDVPQERAEELRLTPEQALRTRNYYLYLYGLPMKLADPGAIVHPQATRTTFDGEEALELRVTYEPEVGGDVWYFYFDPEDFRMIGYRFYHDELAGDGESILLEGLWEIDGLRLPRSRTWYTHRENRLLGTDTIVGP